LKEGSKVEINLGKMEEY